MALKNTLIYLPADNFDRAAFDEASKLAHRATRVYYVTLTKTNARVKEGLRPFGADPAKFAFLDAITPKLFPATPPPDCDYLESVDDPTHLATAIADAMRSREADTLVLDSLSWLLTYHKEAGLLTFLRVLLAHLDTVQSRNVFFALTADANTKAFLAIKPLMQEVLAW